MKKITLAWALILQLTANPSLLYAGILEDSETKNPNLMPETHATGAVEDRVEDMNQLLSLVEKPAEPASPSYTSSINLGPLSSGTMTVTVDENARTVTFRPPSSNRTLSGTLDPSTLAVAFGSSTDLLRYELTFSRENGQLRAHSMTSQMNSPGLSVQVLYRFSADGRISNYRVDFSTPNLKQHVELNGVGSDSWDAVFSSTDPNQKTLTHYRGILASADVQNFADLGIDAQIRRVENAASSKTDFFWGAEALAYQSDKNEAGEWARRSKMVLTGGIRTYIMDIAADGGSSLFLQNQTLAEWPDYKVSFGESWADDGRYEGHGMIFTSAGQKILVDYPHTSFVELQGKRYLIQLNAAGQVTLKEGAVSSDFNQDGKTDDMDVDLMVAASKENRFEPRFDLNQDGKLDRADIKIAAELYVEELKKTNTVLFVDPSQPDALTKVRDSVRLLTAGGMTKNVVVLLKEGEYYESSFQLDGRDSGKNGFQIVYRGYPGQEKPQIIGGKLLDAATWQKAAEFPGNVYKMDLNAGGTPPDFDTIFIDGKTVVKSRSSEIAVTNVPDGNNLLTLFPNAVQWAYWDGTKTILLTQLPATTGGIDQRPLREEHFFGVKMTVEEIQARRAADPSFRPDHIDSYAQFTFAEGALSRDMDLQNATAEIWTSGFSMNLIKIKHIDWDTRTVTLDGPTIWSMGKDLVDGAYVMGGTFAYRDVHQQFMVVQGSKTFLSEGEYFYSGGVLYYQAPTGQTMAGKKTVIPTTKQVLSIKGTEADPVHDIVFDRLDISVSHAVKEFKNNTIAQDYLYLPEEMSALYFQNTRNITLQNSVIHDTGAVGLLLDGISVGNKIVHNTITHTGADGMVVNGDKTTPWMLDNAYRPTLLSHDNLIANNEISYAGDVFAKSDGLRIVQSANNMVSGNNIHHVGASGIFLIGMQEFMIAVRAHVPTTRDKDDPNYDLYYEFNLANNNQFLNNEISHIGLASGEAGGFYTHSAGKNNVISGNNIHDIYHGQTQPPLNIYWASSYGIYLDGGQSDYFTITNNHLHGFDTELGMPITVNGSHNVITDNLIEQNNSSAPIQFFSGWDFSQRGNVLERNVFKNSDPNAKVTMGLWQYLVTPYREGMAIPEGGFIVNKKVKPSSPYQKFLYVPAQTFASNDHNTYNFASHEYNVFTDWSDLTTFIPDASMPGGGYEKLVLKSLVSYTDWRTTPLPGYTDVFEENSVFIK